MFFPLSSETNSKMVVLRLESMSSSCQESLHLTMGNWWLNEIPKLNIQKTKTKSGWPRFLTDFGKLSIRLSDLERGLGMLRIIFIHTTHTSTHTHIHTTHMSSHIYMHIYTYTHAYIHIHTYIYIHAHIRMHASHTYTCTWIHTHPFHGSNTWKLKFHVLLTNTCFLKKRERNTNTSWLRI